MAAHLLPFEKPLRPAQRPKRQSCTRVPSIRSETQNDKPQLIMQAIVLLAAAGLAAATTISVAVGKDGLTFEPNKIQAHVGDAIEFRFYAKNHSVVAGDF